MTDRPILFSAPIVRAILDERKTQTRRVLKPQRGKTLADYIVDAGPALGGIGRRLELRVDDLVIPYAPGDRLWVREAWKDVCSGEVRDGYGEVRYGTAYRADGHIAWCPHTTIIHDLTAQPPSGPMQFAQRPWRTSIHMPRRASRLTLIVERVRVERLQDISERDAEAEGARPIIGHPPVNSYVDAFRDLWNTIHGAAAWDENPWVAAITFRVIHANIDSPEARND